jgi:thioredoxin reductase (NADPH)
MEKNNHYDVIIVGAGPAGMAAALAIQPRGYQVLLLEKSMPGGKLNTYQSLANFPGYEHLNAQAFGLKLYDQLTQLGISSTYGEVTDVQQTLQGFNVTTDVGNFFAKSVILASGSREKPLTIPGAETLLGQGISYCAACDGGFFKDKDVAVIGNDRHALEETIYLANLCHHVYLLLPPFPQIVEQNLLVKINQIDRISILKDVTPIAVLGNQFVTGIRYQTDVQGEQEILVDGIFPILGWVPNHLMAKAFPSLYANDGYLIAQSNGVTTIPGLFVIGDLQSKATRTIKNVMSQGTVVAQAIATYLG